jgi:F0F1-type ATP synthase membrane subunit a
MKLIYYTLYRWAQKYNFWDTPQLSAMYFLSLFVFINILSLYGIIAKGLLKYSSSIPQISKIYYILFLAIIVFIVYILYVQRNKYLIITSKFEKTSDFNKRKANTITVGYIIITIVLSLALAFYKPQ